MYNKREQGGFTLIEILVVLGIIGLLMGMLFAVMGQMRNQARRAKTASDVTQIATAWNAYLQDYRLIPGLENASEEDFFVMRADAVRVLGGRNTGGANPERIAYLDLSRELESTSPEMLDPWGLPYRFNINSQDWVLGPDRTEYLGLHVIAWSAGPDGEDGTNDDIVSAR